jgi:EmrB/QacA subfamily drug resistance transporter
MTEQVDTPPILGSSRGKALLILLLGVGFLDFVDASIVNFALPSIRVALDFTVQNLQWVLSAYLLTYGGLILLGGRLADLFGRRRILVAGTVVFTASSMTAGLAASSQLMVASRLVQGVGAALMVPAALSILTTTFSDPGERQKALGAWGALAGLASGFGVFLGGVISDLIDWRWVFFVNLPVALAILVGIFRLVPHDGPVKVQRIDVVGAVLITVGMLFLVYTIVQAPVRGWSDGRTIGGFAGAGALLATFLIWEIRQQEPLFPLSVLRVRGLAAADVTMVVAMAGFYSMFFFITLYMQNVLGFSPIQTGSAYIPVTLMVAIGAGVGTGVLARAGTRPVIVAGAVLGAAGIFWLSHIPVDGAYLSNLLPALLVMAFGLGGVFVGVTTAAQAGVPEEQAGLAAALINSSQWLGGALGIAIFSAIATAQTADVLAGGGTTSVALTEGFQDALLWAAIFIAVAAVIALRSPNTRGHEVGGAPATTEVVEEPVQNAPVGTVTEG